MHFVRVNFYPMFNNSGKCSAAHIQIIFLHETLECLVLISLLRVVIFY